MKNKEIYRHYGSDKFEKDKFKLIMNREYSNKPFGGLWSSPLNDVDVSWKEWCEIENLNTSRLEKYFDFTLKDNAKVLTIKNGKDLEKLPRRKILNKKYLKTNFNWNFDIDFEKLAKKYDAIMVYLNRDEKLEDFTDGLYYKMYGWDCNTLLVLNPNAIEII